MFEKQTFLVIACSLACILGLSSALASASPWPWPHDPEYMQMAAQLVADRSAADYEPTITLVRRVRSPQHGNVNIDYNKDRFGQRAGVEYNHNLYSNGRGSIDAYARGERDFTHNRNDFGGGIRGSFRF